MLQYLSSHGMATKMNSQQRQSAILPCIFSLFLSTPFLYLFSNETIPQNSYDSMLQY